LSNTVAGMNVTLIEEILDTLSPQELGRLPESVWALPDFMPPPTTPRRERDYRERENPKPSGHLLATRRRNPATGGLNI
jgi:hypothetical protein